MIFISRLQLLFNINYDERVTPPYKVKTIFHLSIWPLVKFAAVIGLNKSTLFRLINRRFEYPVNKHTLTYSHDWCREKFARFFPFEQFGKFEKKKMRVNVTLNI